MIPVQVDGTKASSPAFKMGSSSRFADKNPMNDVPGVGSYASAVPAYGKQVLSSKSTLPTLKMGTSTRDQALKVLHRHQNDSYAKRSQNY